MLYQRCIDSADKVIEPRYGRDERVRHHALSDLRHTGRVAVQPVRPHLPWVWIATADRLLSSLLAASSSGAARTRCSSIVSRQVSCLGGVLTYSDQSRAVLLLYCTASCCSEDDAVAAVSVTAIRQYSRLHIALTLLQCISTVRTLFCVELT